MNYKKFMTMLTVSVVWAVAISGTVYGEDRFADAAARQMAIEMTEFIQIPGPNPILVGSGPGAWDEHNLETCTVFKDEETYYMYYHAQPLDDELWPHLGYRIGVATASHPLGPWTKYEKNPILDSGPKGSWDAGYVACAAVLKEKGDKYYMWYYSRIPPRPGKMEEGRLGLAYASDPLGPWTKYEGNPIMPEPFGFVGGVVKVKDKYYMYTVYVVSSTSPNQGHIYIATADKPEGPWRRYEDKPVIAAGDWGAWDDGGYSEAGVLYHDGVFHMLYSGTKWRKLESIGYAYSFDGFNWFKYSRNPIALRERNPDASAFAEIHALWEPPFYYAYHTLRYISKGGEDLGVQILATRTPFRLAMPVLSMDSLATGTSSELASCPPISLENISDVSLTVKCSYDAKSKAGVRVNILSSWDGLKYDTEPLYSFDILSAPGQRVSKTFALDAKVMFIKVVVENPDKVHDVKDIEVIATLGQD
ncbi:hypothetical protein ACFL1G_01545 [Planctomycetota bacterium]